MDKSDPTKLKARFDNTKEGWLVQVYSADRHLLCVIDSSHLWSFLIGCALGLLLAVAWFNLAQSSQSKVSEASTEPINDSLKMWID